MPDRIPRLFESNGFWNWKPNKALRPTWKNVALGRDAQEARAEARRLNARVVAWQKSEAAKRPIKQRARPRSVAELATLFRHEDCQAWRELRPSTQQLYRDLLKRLEAEFGHEVAAAIDGPRVQEWLQPLRRRAPQTARQIVSIGRTLFGWAARQGHLPAAHNPFVKLKVGSGRKRKFRFRWADVVHILAVAAEQGRPSVGVALVVAFCTLQRITDVIILGDQHVFEQPGQRRPRLRFVQSKGTHIGPDGVERPGFALDMEIPPAVLAVLERYPAPAVPGLNWRQWIVSEDTGHVYHEKTISRVFARVLEAAIAVDPVKWAHLAGGQLRDGRRSGFVHLIEQGCSVEFATSLSGHSIEEGYAIVEHYLPRTAEMADKATAFMGVRL